jgi:hypothetical protein
MPSGSAPDAGEQIMLRARRLGTAQGYDCHPTQTRRLGCAADHDAFICCWVRFHLFALQPRHGHGCSDKVRGHGRAVGLLVDRVRGQQHKASRSSASGPCCYVKDPGIVGGSITASGQSDTAGDSPPWDLGHTQDALPASVHWTADSSRRSRASIGIAHTVWSGLVAIHHDTASDAFGCHAKLGARVASLGAH